METLLIRIYPSLAADEPLTVEWLTIDANHRPTGEIGHGTLDEAAQARQYRRTVVLVPSENISLARIDIKARNRERLARAMPYALEEDLAEDVEQLHFAPGPRQPDGSHPVAVVARLHMTHWLTQLQAAGIVPKSLIPDVLALPVAADNSWSLLLEKDRALLRTGPFSGFALEPINLEVLLSCALEEAASQPGTIEVYRCDRQTERRLPALPSISYEQRDGCPPQLWTAGLDEKRSINLLQDQYRIKSDISRVLRPWRAAAALAAVWLALQVVEIAVDYRQLAAEEHTLQAEIEQIYRDTFPSASRIVNPRVQMEQQLKALHQAIESDTGEMFMRLLDASARAIQGLSGVRIEALDYLDGRLELSLSARELHAFETIKQGIEAEGLIAKIESAETRGANVNGRLMVKEARG
jgi:general secretion pathway protein L